MEGLISVIIVIVMALLSSGMKNKKNARKGVIQDPVAKNAPIHTAPKPAAKAAASLSKAEREARLTQLREKRAERMKAAKVTAAPQAVAMQAQAAQTVEPVPQGTSLTDDEGCVGGSLPHDHEEGEGHEEHARHMADYARRELDERTREEHAGHAGLNLSDVRRAVVMAEILGKPKALQRRS